jgi:beta-glucosidase/6-phospho-beta-glucosidase/beta-galactosidase
MFSVERGQFGPNFVFGAATAAYQIEGGQIDGRGPGIWDSFAATPGNVKRADDGRDACDHYHRWPEDLDLVRDAGFDGYRFSLAWPRLIPQGTGAVNPAGLDFYDRLIDGMLERGIKPFATLYHWDLPSPLQDRGGWMNRDIAGWFADYAALVGRHFGDRLHATATINEPWCVSVLSHILGIHAPGYRDLRAGARAMHHVLLAHGTGVDALRANGVRNVGIVTNLEKSEPASDREEDRRACDIGDALFNRWFLGGVYKGQYPEVLIDILGPYLPADWQKDMEVVSRPLDWAGINYYSRGLYAWAADQRPRLGNLPAGADGAARARLARIHQAADLRHRERHVGGRRHAPRGVLRRAPQGAARRAAAGRGRTRLFRLVAARQLRVGGRLRLALRHRACGLRHADAHPQGQLPRLPGDAAQYAVRGLSSGLRPLSPPGGEGNEARPRPTHGVIPARAGMTD